MTSRNQILALIALIQQETIWVPASVEKKAFEEILKISGLSISEDEQIEIEAFWDYYSKSPASLEDKSMSEIIQEYKSKLSRMSK